MKKELNYMHIDSYLGANEKSVSMIGYLCHHRIIYVEWLDMSVSSKGVLDCVFAFLRYTLVYTVA